MYGVEMETNAPYPNDQEMEDTASSPVLLVDEVVPESDVPSLGLTPTDPPPRGESSRSDRSVCDIGKESR